MTSTIITTMTPVTAPEPIPVIVETFIICFFSSLIITYILFLICKTRNKSKSNKNINMIFNYAVYIITLIFLAMSFTIDYMAEKPFEYQIFMFSVTTLSSLLIIFGGNIKSIFGIEMADKEKNETTNELIEYADYATEMFNKAYMFSTKLLNQPDKQYDFEEFKDIWNVYLEDFKESKAIQLEQKNLDTMTDATLMNYVKNIVTSNNLWYDEKELGKVVHDIKKYETVLLSNNIYLIPAANIFHTLVYVRSEVNLTKLDAQFILLTYNCTCLTVKKEV